VILRTVSGSVYELDEAAKRLRRLSGVRAATARQGADGAWRQYDQLGPDTPVVGLPLFVKWADESVGPAAVPGAYPGTMTSIVIEVNP
jgi:hypothetical protein